ncbi:MAG: nitroreductase family protein [Candidatus Omnitrophota bacterium]|nr:nitroreductase family protein [Candidatus Omnitrophota bacterium]
MGVFEVIKKRRSIRAYLEKEVEQDKLLKILEAAQAAPSANNCQEWRFVVVGDKEKRKQLSIAARGQAFVATAPIVIACCAQTDERKMTCGQVCYPIDVTIAIDHMILTATELGLGTCWIGAFYPEQVKEILDIPPHIKVVELLTLGYAQSVASNPKQRLPLNEIIFRDKWGKTCL